HVEGNAALVERDEEPAEPLIERIDVVEEAELIRLAPGEDLPADADEHGPLLEVEVAHEEAVPLPRVRAEVVDVAVDEALRDARARDALQVRHVEPHRAELRPDGAELVGPVVVEPLAL